MDLQQLYCYLDHCKELLENGAAVMERDWSLLFSVPMYAALACLAILLAFYPRSKRHVAG